MFSSKEYIDKKTGPYGIGRFSYMRSLVTEFQDTDSEDAKKQVLANLANFAYDPINYEHIRKLNIIELFLDCLSESDEVIVQFAIGGLNNCCLDKTNKEFIVQHDGIDLVIGCLSSSDEETVLSAITTLMFLVTPQSKPEITSPAVVECMSRFAMSSNTRLSNLAQVILQDYCTEEQRQMAPQQLSQEGEEEIG